MLLLAKSLTTLLKFLFIKTITTDGQMTNHVPIKRQLLVGVRETDDIIQHFIPSILTLFKALILIILLFNGV